MPDQQVIIRPVRQEDNPQLIELIKTVMTEIVAAGEGFSIRDPEVLSMSTNYQGPSAGYYVLVRGAEVLGGAGFAALTGGEPGVFFLPLEDWARRKRSWKLSSMQLGLRATQGCIWKRLIRLVRRGSCTNGMGLCRLLVL